MNRTELLLHVTIAPHCRSLTTTPAGTPGPGAHLCLCLLVSLISCYVLSLVLPYYMYGYSYVTHTGDLMKFWKHVYSVSFSSVDQYFHCPLLIPA